MRNSFELFMVFRSCLLPLFLTTQLILLGIAIKAV